MLSARDRLHNRAKSPRFVALYRALTRLKSTVTVMNTGAHPDDEHNSMLASLRHEHGARIVVACSTRGEGGQNTLGPERLGALGVVRSRELEEAARVIDADIAWLGHGPNDPVHDFGFSKSGPDTLARWGKERTIDRLVRAYREFRPDIVIPTFLDVPGQHGHHRAMTEAAETALALSADPTYEIVGLTPWKVSKYYLPAWSGGGDYYDDEVPPPPATTTIVAGTCDPVTGLSFARLGEVSRAYHATQNMGDWRYDASRWDLHLVGGTAEISVFDALPTKLSDLGSLPELARADAAIASAIAAFPKSDEILSALIEAKQALSSIDAIADHHAHRITRKIVELDAAIVLAAGLDLTASVSSRDVLPGSSVTITIESAHPLDGTVTVTPVAPKAFASGVPVSFSARTAILTVEADPHADVGNPYYPNWFSLGGNGALWLEVEAEVSGTKVRFALDTEEVVQIAPAKRAAITPEALILALPAQGQHSFTVKSTGAPSSVSVENIPSGLSVKFAGDALRLTATPDLTPGKYHLPLSVDGLSAHVVTPIAYEHIGTSRYVRPLTLDILALDLKVPDTKVGIINGGADNVSFWLKRMGANVIDLDAEALAGDLSVYDTIIVGLFAFGTRPDLKAVTSKLHTFVEDGGHLVTLYHRPTDGWDKQTPPPRPLTIGSPSLRWRVNNPSSTVEILQPNHPLFAGPNTITRADFDGWDKERGLYFVSHWDEAYEPLLSMNDVGENPLFGSLVSGRIGKGRHTHTSLVLHHQLDKLVPGAFRIMANLLQRA
ncbi:PIG-L family deacetylase [Devosia sp. WQ 349]|uniref:PIG-L family deacetylase n=1 Tax=Devosia sp. WQ 349K1 TaxID=2800329 RepID=UPI0019031C5B|nr:PIG-L family deacetylase [Devosia sp. WQ 349K1]MBK1793178.1 PIG-L family deacetylase [Devosia sp. WQ 349K1]